MTFTTDNGEVALVFRDVAHTIPTPDEFNSANHLGLTKMVIWVRDGSEEKWQVVASHWRAVRCWKETP